MSIQKIAFSCRRDSFTIRGFEYIDESQIGNTDKPVAIISHGFMANQTTTKAYAEMFARNGYAAYTFDFVGGCVKGTSDGSMATDMTVGTEVRDLKAVIEYIKSNCSSYADTDRITLMGCSQGGVVSALTAGDLKDEIERLVLFYPALCIPEDSHTGKMIMFEFDPKNVPDRIHGFGHLYLNGAYVREAQKMDILATAVQYKGPVLIIHGSGDDLVDCRYSREAVKAYRAAREPQPDPNRGVDFILLRDAPHGFRGIQDKEAMQMVECFLRGKQVILTIHVLLDGHSKEKKGKNWILTLPFHGNSQSSYFKGQIAPGAADVQERHWWTPIEFRADYHLIGTDKDGEKTDIHIVNVFRNGVWKPEVSTDSKSLTFLNDGTCEAVLEGHKEGPTVRIWH